MGIRDALSAVPAKPIIAAAIGLTILVAAWHGWSVRKFCTNRANQSAAFQLWAKNAIAGSGAAFRLDQATGFDWDKIAISQGDKSPSLGQNCPFGWHWNNTERARMAEVGELTLIGFFSKGRLVNIVDFDARWARFEVAREAIGREQAVFTHSAGAGVLRLSAQ